MNSFMMLSSAAFGLPVVHAKVAANSADSVDSKNCAAKVKVSSIPLYPEPVSWEYSAKPASQLEELVKKTRIEVTNTKAEYQPVLDKITHVVETGIAHTNQALFQVRNDTTTRVGIMALGGMVAGLVAARRRGLYNKMTAVLIGVGGTGVLCYPDQAKVLAGDAGKLAVKNARIAYHFIVGARPPIQNENGKPFERVMGMTSDIGKWGFNLFQKKNPTNVESEVITPEPAPESQQEESKPLEKSDSTDEAPAPGPAEVKENAPPSEIIKETSIDSTTESNGEVVVSAVEVEVSPAAPESPQIHEENIESAPSAPSTTTSCSDTVPSEDALIPEAETTAPIEQEIPQVEEPKNGKLETAPTPAATTVYEGDLGQGTLEDKELYTTRE
ncbi:hypothetical protein DAPPUDRAFT_325779 [Daphnia pulex]|uniref:MICOS complex subunit n=1 Tax=Daphnia pulex TaxID=6669 RepID=E9H5J5_DAPPU|nr:hypothetical protein DAPPUDRAFT_325779 [Daphnia pulex]|eukprot:EFX72971.1 hypothetical protein DAPPUDRAFT_325779 [Daphnia pulex]